MKNVLKLSALVLCVIVSISCFSGCGGNNSGQEVGKVTITVSNYPPETFPEDRTKFDHLIKSFEEKFPDIKVVGDTYEYKVDTFIPKAASGQLPTLYRTWFTETSKIIDAGYASDLTEYVKNLGYDTAMNPQVMNLVSKNGQIYGMPSDAYCMGLLLNMELFREAELVNPDGTAQFPQNYEELAEIASLIKERTGQAGFALPTFGNFGGWHFMNIAWSFGTQFMKQENGKWVATFDSPECAAALQYVKDLKWKYDALAASALLDADKNVELFGSNQAAMIFLASSGSLNNLISKYNMDRSDISMVSMPAGPGGAFAQTGGSVYFVAPNATPEQVEAGFEWLKFRGLTSEVNDDVLQNWTDSYKLNADRGFIVGYRELQIWDSPERNQALESVINPLINVDIKLFEDYNKKERIQLHVEEPMQTQELYKMLDSLIQEVLTNKDADVEALLKNANSDFQTNYLNNVN